MRQELSVSELKCTKSFFCSPHSFYCVEILVHWFYLEFQKPIKKFVDVILLVVSKESATLPQNMVLDYLTLNINILEFQHSNFVVVTSKLESNISLMSGPTKIYSFSLASDKQRNFLHKHSQSLQRFYTLFDYAAFYE